MNDEAHKLLSPSPPPPLQPPQLLIIQTCTVLGLWMEPGYRSRYNDYAMEWMDRGPDPGRGKKLCILQKRPDRL
jgi:hypothetical protein